MFILCDQNVCFSLINLVSHLLNIHTSLIDNFITIKSKEYGINSTSTLNDLHYFHTCTGALLPDIMHDVLEGGLQYEAKLMLKKFVCEDKYFTIDDLNYCLENYEFGYMDVKNRPTPITAKTLSNGDNSLKQNGKQLLHNIPKSNHFLLIIASQMWLLGRSLPLLIGSRVPLDDEHWKNFCRFLSITQILFSPVLTENDLAVLQDNIMVHHQQFVALYPSHSVIPKLHYLIHTPRLIYEYVQIMPSHAYLQ